MNNTSVQINIEEVRQALQYDPEFFIQFFLGEEIHLPVPEFHKDIFSVMTAIEIDRFVCAIPRDHAKTTLAKLTCVYYFLFSSYRFIVYLSNTSEIAVPSTNDIVDFLKSDNFQNAFGVCHFITEQHGKGIYKFVLPESFGSKTCILRALGAGKQVRGINVDNIRPQLAIVDDLEDNDNIATEDLFRKLKHWVYGPFIKCLDKFNNKVIWLGNMISKQSLLYENCNSEFWYSRRYGCLLASGEALWPDAWPLEKLQRDYAEYQEKGLADIWFAEMMNLPMSSGSGLIDASEITYRPAIEARDHKLGFLTVDLAISKEKWAHRTCIGVHSWVDDREDPYWHFNVGHAQRGMDTIALFWKIVEIAQEWGYMAVGIESEAFQASLQHVFPHLCLVHGIEGLTFFPLKTYKKAKTARIKPWADMIKVGRYAITEGDFVVTQQLLEYNAQQKTNDDDVIDTGAYGPQMFAEYYYEIHDSIKGADLHLQSVQSAYEVARL
jgi:hypothetical protein